MYPLLIAAVALLAPAPHAPTSGPEAVAVAHWELDGSLASSVGGAPLRAIPPEGVSFVAPTVGPVNDATILRLAPGTMIEVPTGFRPDGPGFVGRWTLIADIRIAEEDVPFAFGLLQTDVDNDDFAELYANSVRGFGFERKFFGALSGGAWHRLVMTADRDSDTVSVFLNGAKVASTARALGDSRYALEPSLLLFADKTLKAPAIDIATIHVRTEPLTESAIAALGNTEQRLPTGFVPAGKVVGWELRLPNGAAANGAPGLVRGQRYLLTWESTQPAGDVALVARPLKQGGNGRNVAPHLLGRVPMAAGRAVVHLPMWLDGDRLVLDLVAARDVDPAPRVQVSPVDSKPGVNERSFQLQGPVVPDFDLELVANGNFEAAQNIEGATKPAKTKTGDGPASWRIEGGAALGRIGPGFHLVGGAGDWTATQDLDIPEHLLADGALGPAFTLAVSAEFRREFRRGRLDDRGWLEAEFLGANGDRLGAIRTLQSDGQAWHGRAANTPLPEGTRRIVMRVVANHRRGGLNSVRVDNVSARLVPTAAVAATGLRKLPILHASDDPGLHRLVLETVGPVAVPEVMWGPAEGPMVRAPLEATTITEDHQIWQVALTPLIPGAEHFHEVRVGSELAGRWSFRAPSPDEGRTKSLRVAWMADNQFGWETFAKLLPIVKEKSPDLLVLAGDIVQNGDQRREWQTEWFSPLASASFGQTIATQFARGNHDGEHALSYAYTWLPGNGAWFAYTRGHTRFIFLDTEAAPRDTPEQVAWLSRELHSPESRNADFRIVVMHKPAYTNRWDSPKSTYDGESQVRQHFVPLFHSHGVDLVVAGHAHAYQRRDFQGVRYVVVGGAGGRLDSYKTADWPMAVEWVGYHFALLDTIDGRLDWVATGLDGTEVDRFTLKRRKLPTGPNSAGTRKIGR